MTKTIYWTAYETWLKCPQLHSYVYNDHLPKGEPVQPGSPLDLGIRIGKCLANRLRDPEWRPTVGHNRTVGGLDGITGVLKEYDARYRSDRLLGPWKAEQAFTKLTDFWTAYDRAKVQAYPPGKPNEMLNVELGCVVDGLAGDLVRETKVTDVPNLYLFRAQLLWNCFCAGVQQGELDLILRPGYHRPDWAFERRLFIFTEEHKQGLIFALEKFLDNQSSPWKNPNQCGYCPHVERCWGVV